MPKPMDAKVIYIGVEDVKKSATGKVEYSGEYLKVDLLPSKRRSKFNTILIPWNRVIKVIVY